jgi:hypothetical protein
MAKRAVTSLRTPQALFVVRCGVVALWVLDSSHFQMTKAAQRNTF